MLGFGCAFVSGRTFLVGTANISDPIWRWRGTNGGAHLTKTATRCFSSDRRTAHFESGNATGLTCRLYVTANALTWQPYDYLYQVC